MVPDIVTAKLKGSVPKPVGVWLEAKLSAIGSTADAIRMDTRPARRRGSRHHIRHSRASTAPKTDGRARPRSAGGINASTALSAAPFTVAARPPDVTPISADSIVCDHHHNS